MGGGLSQSLIKVACMGNFPQSPLTIKCPSGRAGPYESSPPHDKMWMGLMLYRSCVVTMVTVSS